VYYPGIHSSGKVRITKTASMQLREGKKEAADWVPKRCKEILGGTTKKPVRSGRGGEK